MMMIYTNYYLKSKGELGYMRIHSNTAN